jgi:hypothetical protein
MGLLHGPVTHEDIENGMPQPLDQRSIGQLRIECSSPGKRWLLRGHKDRITVKFRPKTL